MNFSSYNSNLNKTLDVTSYNSNLNKAIDFNNYSNNHSNNGNLGWNFWVNPYWNALATHNAYYYYQNAKAALLHQNQYHQVTFLYSFITICKK